MLKHRLLTAIILFPILISLIFFLSLPFFAVFMALIIVLMLREWLRLSDIRQPLWLLFGVIFIGVACCLLYSASAIPLLVLNAFFWIYIAWSLYTGRFHNSARYLLRHQWVYSSVGLFILISYWKSVMVLVQLSPRPWWLLFGIFMIWSADIGAYSMGRLWGQNKRLLAPSISPKKTWIGLWGGLFFGVLTTVLMSFYLPLNAMTRLGFIGISVGLILFSVMGDLFESVLKRHAQVKDSGEILPGHGGLLDRLDSTLAALPLLALFLIVAIAP